MGRSIFRWLAILNVVVALVLTAVAVSQKKTFVRVKENTMTTLTGANDQHTDFVRHMLGFVTSETSKMTNVAFLAAVWLAVNAVVSWWFLGRQYAVGETQPNTPPK